MSSHGNHELAIFLTNVYDNVPRVQSQPVLLLAATALTAPQFRLVGLLDASLTQTAHGPPTSAWLTRGPPSLA